MTSTHSNTSTCIELVKGLEQCEPNVKAMNLRALLANSSMQTDILKATGDTILVWLNSDGRTDTGLTDEEKLRLRATVMRVKRDRSWFNPNDAGELQACFESAQFSSPSSFLVHFRFFIVS